MKPKSGKQLIIRQLDRSDIPRLRELAIRIYRETFTDLNTPSNMEAFLQKDYSIESFNREFDEEGSTYFFACDGDIPAGYLRLRRSDEALKQLGSNTIELHRLYIDTRYQGQGVGKLLMEFAIDRARQLGVDWLWLGVWEHNPRAQKFYNDWGFERFGEHIFQMGDEAQTDWLLKKRIRTDERLL